MLNLLGKGGFASVYRAKCLRTGAEVAIKMVSARTRSFRSWRPRVFPSFVLYFTCFGVADQSELRTYLNCYVEGWRLHEYACH